jgi:hypothetical protein
VKAQIVNVELKSRRDVKPHEDWDGKTAVHVGPWEYTARIDLTCDQEFWEELWRWCTARGVRGGPALPSGTLALPPAAPAPELDFEEPDRPELGGPDE